MMTEQRGNVRLCQFVIFLVVALLVSVLDDVLLPGNLIRDASQSTVAKSLVLSNNGEAATAMHQASSHYDDLTAALIQHQLQLQTTFQDLLYQNQNPADCTTRRILLTPNRSPLMDGFTLEVQDLGRKLLSAMAQDRTFVLRLNFRSSYAPDPCQWTNVNMTGTGVDGQRYECLFEPISNCTEVSIESQNNVVVNASTPQALGIVNHAGSKYFHSGHFGHDRVRDDVQFRTEFVNSDHLLHWERTMGRFWLRAQMAHYLWKPSVGLASEMKLRLPNELMDNPDTKFIGMHVRYSDNVGSLYKDFGRDASKTRSVEHFMDMARAIRNETGISTIYLATDSTLFLDALHASSHHEREWTFVIQPNVTRTASTAWLWFRHQRSISAAGIAADVEVLRRADYLIGSFQSNVFRLAAELNTAYHVKQYPISMNRHRTVDVEWYEDP